MYDSLDQKMESSKVSSQYPSKFGSVARSVTKILRLSRLPTTVSGGAGGSADEEKVNQGKLSQNLSEHSSDSTSGDPSKAEYEKPAKGTADSSINREAMAALVGSLFVSISAIKASYAQLQIAQVPYNHELIQASDKAIVAEFKRISELKKTYQNRQFEIDYAAGSQTPVIIAKVEEQRNLIKTYQITVNKLEKEFKLKDKKILSLESKLVESEKKIRSLETERHPSRSLAILDDLHLSGLNPAHFLIALRFAYKSIRSFVNLMMKKMASAGLDLNAAAASIQPIVLRRKTPGHLALAFQSFVCLTMFSKFNHKSFNLGGLENRSTWERSKFFKEFTELKSSPAKSRSSADHQVSPARAALAKFYQAKYSELVHRKLERSIFGDVEQRFDGSFTEDEFFAGFLEMARRVWLLNCLFFSFDPENERLIFQVSRGSRFSKTFMDSVGEEDGGGVAEGEGHGHGLAKVGFTVVPGFKVGQTVIQCKVYLFPNAAMGNERS